MGRDQMKIAWLGYASKVALALGLIMALQPIKPWHREFGVVLMVVGGYGLWWIWKNP
jgi:hypothetical protein